MKTLIRLALPLCAVTSLMYAQESQTWPEPIPVPVPGCHAKGVTMQTFYGNRDDVLRAVRRSGSALEDFRMHLVFVESTKGVEALLYERADGQWNVRSWKGTSIGDVRHKLDAMVLRTRGSACAGEELKAVLANQRIDLGKQRPVTAETLESIVVPALSSHSTGYLRVTVLDPCETGAVNVARR